MKYDLVKAIVIGIGKDGCEAVSRLGCHDAIGIVCAASNTTANVAKLSLMGWDISIDKESRDSIREEILGITKDKDIVFVTGTVDSGNESQFMPVIAESARQSNALTISVVNALHTFGQSKQRQLSDEIIRDIEKTSDACVAIRLMPSLFYVEGGKARVNALLYAIQVICDMLNSKDNIRLDLSDLEETMKNAGPACLSVGIGSGRNRGVTAAIGSLYNPFSDLCVSGARRALVRVAGGSDLRLGEVNDVVDTIRKIMPTDAVITFGVAQNHMLKDTIKVTLLATNFAS